VAIEHVHDQSGNFLVEVNGDTATAFCYGVAYDHHVLDDLGATETLADPYPVYRALRDGGPCASSGAPAGRCPGMSGIRTLRTTATGHVLEWTRSRKIPRAMTQPWRDVPIGASCTSRSTSSPRTSCAMP